MTDVENRFVCANGNRGYRQTLDNPERKGFEQHSVHKGAGVAFVTIADDVLGFAWLLPGRAPLCPCREAGSPAPAKARVLDQVDDLLRGERLVWLGKRMLRISTFRTALLANR